MKRAPVEAKLRYSLGRQSKPLSADAGLEALLGYTAGDLLAGRVDLSDRIHPGDADIAAQLFSSDGKERSGVVHLRLRHADGKIRCVRVEFAKRRQPARQGEPVQLLSLLLQDARSLYGILPDPGILTSIEPMMNAAGEPLYLKNLNHVFTAANRATLEAYSAQSDPSHLLGATCYDVFPEQYADTCYEFEKQVLSGTPKVSEIRTLPALGREDRWVDLIRYQVRDSAGVVIGVFCIDKDISERREAVEKLRESEDMLRESQAIAGLGTYRVDIADGRWTSSEVLDGIFGIGKDYDRIVDNWVALVHPEDREAMARYFLDEVIGQGKDFDKEYRVVRRSDGAVRWVHGLGRLVLSADGRPVKMLGTIKDITERMESQAALRESEESLRDAQKIARLYSYVYNFATGFWKATESSESILGVDAHYPRTRDGWYALVHPADRDRFTSTMIENTSRRQTSVDSEFRIVRPSDGAIRWIKSLGRIEYGVDGKPIRLCGTFQDITDSKLAEIALRESRELLQLFITHAPVALAMFDREMRYLAVSLRWLDLHGLAGVNLIGRSHYEVFPELPAAWREYHRQALAGEAIPRDEYKLRREDGIMLWVRREIRQWYSGDGSIGGIIIFSEDVTEPREAALALSESKEQLELFVAHAPAAMAMFDTEMRYLVVSQRWVADFRMAGKDFIGRSHYEIDPDIPERWRQIHQRCLAGETLHSDEDRLERSDGTVQWIRWETVPWRTGDGAIGGIIIFAEDITKHRETEERLRLAASVFTNASEGILITDPNGRILEVNEMFTHITGYTREDALGQNPRILQSGVYGHDFYAGMWQSLAREGHWSGEMWNRHKNGELIAESLTIDAVRDANGNLQQYVALFSDITQLKKSAQQIEQMAHFDVLTGLPNRVLLADRLQQAMAQANRRQQSLAVAYLDLDGFKAINESHGHDIGDHLLTSLAFNMKCALREGDTLARLGVDEFVAVILDLDDRAAAATIIEQLRQAAAEPVQIGDLSLNVSASLGVTYYPQPEEADPDLLLRQADQAMYQAKLAGGNRCHDYDPEHDHNVRGHHENLEHIRHALAANEFVLYYQPKVNMRTGKVVGVEALIRWQHPERGLLPPGMFLPVIEEHPLAIELGEWVIGTALAQMESWQAQGLELPISVNVGALQLQQPEFVDRLRGLLDAHPAVKPFNLEIEVLETSALRDVVQASQVLNACQRIGVSFALDDFGTGYSSLIYLKRLPANVLKIDQSFVADILDDPGNLNILEGILSLASAFHRTVIAEGVETIEHGLMLLLLGCELAQGYGIARPMPAGDIPAWVATWTPDLRWALVPPVHAGNKALLYACVEHRAWIAAFEAYLTGKRHAPPSMDQSQCKFGSWLQAEGLAGHGSPPNCRSVEAIHSQIHRVASDIYQSQSQGKNAEGLDRLGELYMMCERMAEELGVYGQKV